MMTHDEKTSLEGQIHIKSATNAPKAGQNAFLSFNRYPFYQPKIPQEMLP